MILKLILRGGITCSVFVMLHFRLYNFNWFSPEFMAQERVYEVFRFYNPKKQGTCPTIQTTYCVQIV